MLVPALAVIAGLASAVAFYKANYAKAQLAGLRGDRDDLTERVKRQDDENTLLKRDIEDLRRDLVAEKAARQALEKVVTGRDLLEELKTELETHHRDTTASLRGVHSTMEQVVEVLQDIKALVAA
jgi:chromosome segregation ATPase